MTNGGIVGETSKHVGSFMDAMKREPLSLALVIMNLCLLLFFYVFLSKVADQRAVEIGLIYEDKKDVRELLARCVVPQGRTELDGDAIIKVLQDGKREQE